MQVVAQAPLRIRNRILAASTLSPDQRLINVAFPDGHIRGVNDLSAEPHSHPPAVEAVLPMIFSLALAISATTKFLEKG